MPNAGLWTDTVFYVAAAAFFVALAAAAYIWGQRRAAIEAQSPALPEPSPKKAPAPATAKPAEPPKTVAALKPTAEAQRPLPVPLAKPQPQEPKPSPAPQAQPAPAEAQHHLPSFSWGGLLDKMERFEAEIASIKTLITEKSVSGQDVAQLLQKLQSQAPASQPPEEIHAIAAQLERFQGEFTALRSLFEAAAKDNASLREMVSKLQEEAAARPPSQAPAPSPDAGRAVAFIQSLIDKMDHFEEELASVKSLLSSRSKTRETEATPLPAAVMPPKSDEKEPAAANAKSSGSAESRRNPVWPV